MKLDFTALRNIRTNVGAIVYGDQLLDRNSIGSYVGWSRENPTIQVYSATEERFNPGGGGNLACNVGSFLYDVTVCGLWGSEEDIYRIELEKQFNEREIATDGMVEAERTGVFGKQYLRNGVHVSRSDISLPKMYAQLATEMIGKILRILDNNPTQVLVADYDETGFGICRPDILVMFIRHKNAVTFGTSRPRIKEFKNFDFLFLNEKELIEQAINKQNNADENAVALIMHTNSTCLIVTHAGRGVSLYFTDKAIGDIKGDPSLEHLFSKGPDIFKVFVPSIPLKDIDPCGAGDTFMAAFSAAIMANYNIIQAANIGNAASRSVIKKRFGAATSTVDEVEIEFNETQRELSK